MPPPDDRQDDFDRGVTNRRAVLGDANTAVNIPTDALRERDLLPPLQSLSDGPRVVTHHTFSQPQLEVAVQGPADASGVPVVLSHALGLDLSMWDSLAGELTANHPVLSYDHRGHGESAAPAGPYSMSDLVDDAVRLIRGWGRGPVVWVGLSMGGMVGQGLAVRHPELLHGIVLANTSSQYPEAARSMWQQRIATVESEGLGGIADTVMERYFTAAFRAANPDAVAAFRRDLLRTDPAGYVGCCHAVMNVDWLDALPQVKCPTLVIAGALDMGAPVAMSQAIAQQIPDAELVVLAEASHLSVAEQPALFAQHVQRFLRRVPRAGA